MNKKDIKYWAGFSLIPSIGRIRLTQSENYFISPDNAWGASLIELKQAELDSSMTRVITSWRPKISLEAEMEKLDRYGMKVLTSHDLAYPSRLKEMPILHCFTSWVPCSPRMNGFYPWSALAALLSTEDR